MAPTKYYDFFFSFSSRDWKAGKKEDLQTLFNDLAEKLRDHGLHDGGFFAPDAIERGRDWEVELAGALSRSRVLVPVYSPNYFKSVPCGKEWQTFRERAAASAAAVPDPPPIMLPINWSPDAVAGVSDVAELQHEHRATDPVAYTAKGLRYMMQSPQRFRAQYLDLLETLGDELAEMAEQQGERRVHPARRWDEIEPPFPANHRRGLNYIRFAFLAGRSDEMRHLRERQDAYGVFENRQDWRPCFPDIDREAGAMARAVAAQVGKQFEFVEPAELAAKLEDGSALNNIVAVVVDPWSVTLPAFDAFARALDEKPLPNSGVIITWNERDVETQKYLPQLKNNLVDRFRGRVTRREYFNDAVASPEAFGQALMEMFTRAQERLVESGTIRTAATDAGPAPRLPSI